MFPCKFTFYFNQNYSHGCKVMGLLCYSFNSDLISTVFACRDLCNCPSITDEVSLWWCWYVVINQFHIHNLKYLLVELSWSMESNRELHWVFFLIISGVDLHNDAMLSQLRKDSKKVRLKLRVHENRVVIDEKNICK